jgi:pSer/pThr/pTyr-binding forkhead associated (FHA) protein
VPLERPVVLIGRHPDCDTILSHPRVSLRHCCIAQVDDHTVVRDLGSTNGLRINGVRVEEARLESGDELAIGPLIFRYESTPSAKPTAAPPDILLPTELEEDELVPLD